MIGVLRSITCAESYWKKQEMWKGQKAPTTLFPMRDLEMRFRSETSQLWCFSDHGRRHGVERWTPPFFLPRVPPPHQESCPGPPRPPVAPFPRDFHELGWIPGTSLRVLPVPLLRKDRRVGSGPREP